MCLTEKPYRLRKASLQDAPTLFHLRSEPVTASVSFGPIPADIATYAESMKKKLENPLCSWFVAEIDQRIAGYCYLEILKDKSAAEVSIALFPQFRKAGLGRRLIDEVCNIGKEQGIERFVAYTKPDNIASQKAFLAAGFDVSEKTHHRGHKSIALWRKR